jgi:hypothetical protein
MSEQDQTHQALQTITDRIATTAQQDCMQRVADAVANSTQPSTDNTQLLMDLLSNPEPVHFGTLIFPTIKQFNQMSDLIDEICLYAADRADTQLCQMLLQLQCQMDALQPRLIEPEEETTV